LLETNHWAYEYLRRLRSGGYLPQLDPLAQPYRRGDVARALRAPNLDSLPEPAATWVRLLRSEFAGDDRRPQPPQVDWGAVAAIGARAANSRRLDPLRPVGSGDLWPNGLLGLWATVGPLALESRGVADGYSTHDPDGRAPYGRFGGLADHSYLDLTFPLASVTVGRFARNWGPIGSPGFLISDNPASYPSVAVQVRLGRLALEAFTAELDTLAGVKRYLAGHRLGFAGPTFAIAATEAVLYGAPNSAPSLQFLNPAALFVVDQENPPSDDRSQNLMLGLQWWRTWGWLELSGQVLLDDIDLKPEHSRRAPTRYGLASAVRFLPRGRFLEATLSYQRLSSFAYRSNRPEDRYDFLGRGLGDNFADYDLWSASVEFYPFPSCWLAPTFQALRQGEGDLRVPFPAYDQFLQSPSLFLGTVEATRRASLQGRYQPARYVWFAWDLGQNWIRDADHVPGRQRSRFVGLATVGFRLELGQRTPR
jgi:hypothetical protein